MQRVYFFSRSRHSSRRKQHDCFAEQECKTSIKLNGYFDRYRNKAPVELDVIAKKIIEHCLLFFISGKCPKMLLFDGISAPIDLNQYFDENIKDSLNQDHFTIKDIDFKIYHIRLPEGTDAHRLHLCADMQEVDSIELKTKMPDLRKKIIPLDDPTGFFYVGYVTSNYLDSIVNTTRTDFEFDEKGANFPYPAQVKMLFYPRR